MNFKIKQVRDLAWAILSPELSFFNEYHYPIDFDNSDLEWIKNVDENPADFLFYLESNKESKRLGKYFELLLNYFFIHSKGILDLQKGVQIQEDKRTLGELDFLIKPLNCVNWTHLEVAVKFYLAFVEDGTTHFVGPNSKDTFIRKKEKLLNKQIKISKNQIAIDQLKQVGISIEQRAVIMKGILFINPFLKDSLNLVSLNEYCIKGFWYYLSDFVEKVNGTNYIILDKLDWLAEYAGTGENIIKKENLIYLIRQNKLDLPLMWVEVEEELLNEFKEIGRGVLVESDWPQRETTILNLQI